MALTRIKNDQITDATIVGNVKIDPLSITGGLLENDLTYASNLTVTGNLTVNGTTVTIDTTNTLIQDPILVLASNQIGASTLDIGFIGERGSDANVAFVWDESEDAFVAGFTSDADSSTVVVFTAKADLQVGGLTTTGTSSFASLTVTGQLDVNTDAILASVLVEDLTDNRIVIAGTGGELEDDVNFTFDGTTFEVGPNFDVVVASGNLITTGTIDTGAATLDTATVSSLTENRITFAGVSGLLSDNALLTFNGTTFEVGTKFDVIAASGNTLIGGTLGVTAATTLGATTWSAIKLIDAGANKITNVADPSVDQDVVTLAYLNSVVGDGWVLSAGGNTSTISGSDTLTISGTANEVDVAMVLDSDAVTIGLPDNVLIAGTLGLTGQLTLGVNGIANIYTPGTLEVDDIATMDGAFIANSTADFNGLITAGAITFDAASAINMGGNIITNVGEPSVALDATNKAYVDALVKSGTVWRDPIRDSNFVGVTATEPVSPVTETGYIYYVNGITGSAVWTGGLTVNEGDYVYWDGAAWGFIQAVIAGDRFIIAGENGTVTASLYDIGFRDRELIQYVSGDYATYAAWTLPSDSGYDVINFTVTKIGSTATGLANTASTYDLDVTTDVGSGQTLSQLQVVGSAAQTFTTLITELNADLDVTFGAGKVVASIEVEGTVHITNVETGNDVIVSEGTLGGTAGLLATLTDFDSVIAGVEGGTTVVVSDPESPDFSHTYTYVRDASVWTEISGPGAFDAGNQLSYTGTVLNVLEGPGSGLDADTLDGQEGVWYQDWTNTTNKPDPVVSLSGDATGSVTLTDLASGDIVVTVTDNLHAHTIANVTGLQTALDGKLADITAESIKSLSDVFTTMVPIDGQVLTFDTTNGWQSETIPAGVTDHTLLTNIGTNTHAQLDTHLADLSIHKEHPAVTVDNTIARYHLTDGTLQASSVAIDDSDNITGVNDLTVGAVSTFASKVQIDSTGIQATTGTDLIINPPGTDFNTIIRGLLDDTLFVVDAGTDSVNIGTATPLAGVKLQVAGNSSSILSSGTTAQRPVTGLAGMIRYNTSNFEYEFHNGTSWASIGTPDAASLTVAGIVELATVAETNTGTDATRAVTPDGLDGWTGSTQITSLGTVLGFTSTGIDDNATSVAITIDANQNVGIGDTTPAGNGKVHIHTATDPGTTEAALAVTVQGVGLGTAVPQYGIKVVAASYNDATELYGVYSGASQNTGKITYGVYGDITATGSSWVVRHGVHGRGLFNSAANSFNYQAAGVFGEISSVGTSTVGDSSAGYFVNNSLYGAKAYGLVGKTITGTNVTENIPLLLLHDTTEVLKVDSAGDVSVTGTVDGRDIAADGTAQDSHIADATLHFTQAAIVTTGALNAGSITSGFGSIDNGASAITTTGTVTAGVVSTDTINESTAAAGVTVDGVLIKDSKIANTYLNIGTTASTVSEGNHLHTGVYEPANANLLETTDVDDVPVDAASTAPISSNWAFDHETNHPTALTYLTWEETSRTNAIAADSTVEIGNLDVNAGATTIYLNVTCPTSGYAQSASYIINTGWNTTTAAWNVAKPISNSGVYAGNEFDVLVSQSSNVTSLKLRRVSGTTVGTVYISVGYSSSNTAVWTFTSVTGTDTATVVYAGSHSEIDDVPVNGVTHNPISSNWAFDHDVTNDHIDHSTVSVIAGVGLSGGGTIAADRTIDLDFSELTDKTTAIAGTTEFILQDGVTESRKAASEIDLSFFNNDSAWSSTVGTVTSVTGGVGVSSTGGATPSLALTVDELAEKTGALIGTDRLVGTSGTTNFAETISAIPLSIFSNDSAFSSTVGTVTSVGTAGSVSGLTLTGTVTTSGNLTLGGTIAGLDTAVITTGTFADALIAASNVTQHVGAIDHDSLLNFTTTEHYTQAAIVATGALNAGSITSGFGTINNGASTITTTGAVSTGALTSTTTLNTATGNEIAATINYTTNKATSGNDTGLVINHTDTLSPGTSLLFDAQLSTVSKFSVDNAGNVIVAGNLTVSGTTTTVNTETILLADNIITLNSNETGVPSEDGGIEIERGTSTNTVLRWNETTDTWQTTNDGSTYYDIVTSNTTTVGTVTEVTVGAGLDVATGTTTPLISLEADMAAIAALAGTAGILTKTGASTWTLDTAVYSTTVGTVTSVGGTGTISGLTLTGTVTTSGNLTLGGAIAGLDTAVITTGTFANARIAASNVTQHVASIDHDALLNFAVGEHRVINDAGTLTTELFSASKITADFNNRVRNDIVIQNSNPWGINKFLEGTQANRFHGRKDELKVSVDAVENTTTKNLLFDGSYESGLVMGTVAGPDVILSIDTVTNGLTAATGFTYTQGIVYLMFYPGRGPDAAGVTGRWKDKDGVWTTLTFTDDIIYSSDYIGFAATVGAANYLVEIEVTLTPHTTSGLTLGLAEFEYYGKRMTLQQGGAISRIMVNDTPINGNLTNPVSSNWAFDHDVANDHIDHSTITLTAGVGLSGGGTIAANRTFDLDFSELTDKTTAIAGTTEFIIQDGVTESRKAASEIDLSFFNNDSAWSSTVGTVTSVTVGAGLDVATGTTTPLISLEADMAAIAALAGTSGILTKTGASTWTLDTAVYSTTTGTVTSVTGGVGVSSTGGATPSLALTVDELAEKTGAVVGTDRLVGTSGTTNFAETISAIPLSIFSNDSAWSSTVGTVTSVGTTGTVSGLTLTGTVTTSGNLTLGGTIAGLDTAVITTGTFADALIAASNVTQHVGAIDHDSLLNFTTTEHYTQAAIVATGALNAGSITSGFGAIDNGASNITTTGIVSAGTIALADAAKGTATVTTTVTTQTALHTFAHATYGAGEYLIQATQGVNRHITKVLVTHDGTTAIATEYGEVITGSSLYTVQVDISGSDARLLITTGAVTSTVYKTSYTLIEA